MAIAQYKNAFTLLRAKGINWHMALSNEVYGFVLAQGAQKLSAIKFHSKTDFTFPL